MHLKSNDKKAEKILIVDDEGHIRKLLFVTLGYGQYNLYQAANGVDALNIARKIKPEVIILDVMMPGDIDGIEVCRKIKQDPELKHAYVVVLTARGQKADLAAAADAQADAYMIKPFSPLELIESIETRPT